MAKTREQYYNEIIAEKQSLSSLNDLMPAYNLTPPTPENAFVKLLKDIATLSKVGSWRLTAYIVSHALATFDELLDVFKLEIERLAAQSIAGTPKWYADQVLKFQSGFALIFDNATYRYFYVDTTSPTAISARIVKKEAVQELITSNFNGIVIKVAKEPTPGILEPLTNAEVVGLTSYINRIKFAGVQTNIISLASDKLRANIKVYYDGVLDITAFSATIETAIKEYLKAIDFAGIFYKNAFVDALQAVPGLVDVEVLGLFGKADTDLTYTTITRDYNALSGYLELVPIGNTVNDTNIEYIPV